MHDCRAANQLLMNVYRWLASETSLLAAPALLAAVQGAMRKLLLQLVAEAAKLGATIVAANFESIIISTGKYDLPSAVGCAPWAPCITQSTHFRRQNPCICRCLVKLLPPGVHAEPCFALVIMLSADVMGQLIQRQRLQ